MNKPVPPPPDHAERRRALDPERSFLVQAPAGSGKTHLLTQRFLRLLANAERPDQIVAITFTNAAAAEMRNRILEALEAAEQLAQQAHPQPAEADPLSLESLAAQALEHSHQQGWQLLQQPGQLRITTIDAFCRVLALQNPLSWGALVGLGGTLEMEDEPAELYRRAARRTLDRVSVDSPARASLSALLLWRDNNWNDVEALIVSMLRERNRWHHGFIFAREVDWDALRRTLEAPFCRACHDRITTLAGHLEAFPALHDAVLELARGACEAPGPRSPHSLAERAELPSILTRKSPKDPTHPPMTLAEAASAAQDLAQFLLTNEGKWRKHGGLQSTMGFPSGAPGKQLKNQAKLLLDSLLEIDGLEAALKLFLEPMPTAYTDAEWEIIQHCFRVLRIAAGELQVVFAETGRVDFTEIAQIALRILRGDDGFPSDFALRQADQIHHLLIDEFQDTSRNQHELLARLIAAWPDTEGRSCFCVGDPMQSIYGFRQAEVELFERLKSHGLDLPNDPEPFRFEFVALRANFRSVPSLVHNLNNYFQRIFRDTDAADGVRFAAAEPARLALSQATTELHLDFLPSTSAFAAMPAYGDPALTRQAQLDKIVALIQQHLHRAGELRASGQPGKYRIAVLGRTRASLMRIAEALRSANIRFRAIELVSLRERPEVLDALALTQALLNPADRRAWLGILRAPWCGLSLEELHQLTSADEAAYSTAAVPVLLADRLESLGQSGQIRPTAYHAAARVGRVLRQALEKRPESAVLSLGTWIESVWKALGGEATVDQEQGANLRLLWHALDRLPAGELNLLGQALEAALGKLFALPDPAASSDFGVQLMTIHKSKGLEFETVIIPDLDASGRQSEPTMIAWLERGLEEGKPGSELTEFLIAPIQSRGREAGAAKKWVDSVKSERERLESRRLLYVAATRARDQLHLFARPCFSVGKSGSPTLSLPSQASLLRTAWPALEETIQAQFAQWTAEMDAKKTAAALLPSAPYIVPALAAQAAPGLAFPPPLQPTRLRRLPENFVPPPLASCIGQSEAMAAGDEPGLSAPAYQRRKGGLLARAEGTAVHAFLEELSLLRKAMPETEAAAKLESRLGRITSRLRSLGVARSEAEAMSRAALSVAIATLADPVGAWIVTPHPEAFVESRWTGMVQSPGSAAALRSLRPDRVFFAPPHPSAASSGTRPHEAAWWIIDYKTADTEPSAISNPEARQQFLASHRQLYAGQLESYAQMLRGLHNGKIRETGKSEAGQEQPANTPISIRVGIYYPKLLLLDHWQI